LTKGTRLNTFGAKTTSSADTFTYVRGNHTIKTGVEYRHLVLPAILSPLSQGLVQFNGSTAATSSGFVTL
jgi:hypothetical protein